VRASCQVVDVPHVSEILLEPMSSRSDGLQSGAGRHQIALARVCYLPTPICFISVALSQNRYSSAITPCVFQCPRVAIGRW
jgi:hypothetical protein